MRSRLDWRAANSVRNASTRIASSFNKPSLDCIASKICFSDCSIKRPIFFSKYSKRPRQTSSSSSFPNPSKKKRWYRMNRSCMLAVCLRPSANFFKHTCLFVKCSDKPSTIKWIIIHNADVNNNARNTNETMIINDVSPFSAASIACSTRYTSARSAVMINMRTTTHLKIKPIIRIHLFDIRMLPEFVRISLKAVLFQRNMFS
mmetsp:Transcript_26541/g.37283  ORF Transcript_26541/g.37283 Transcript_26541/m.37283 type:complete len:203 (-) Transcript_26541:102-710(-)